ncbi:MAG: ABC transporter permease [Lachnospiraceae bacterium]|nr:ABC transporter permease [Lachnospiraceae bacterium]
MHTITTLAISRIKYNRSRTILTAVSIMLTTILLMAIATSAVGLLDMNRQQAVANGNLHASFSGLTREQVEILQSHMDVEAVDIGELFATVEYEKMNGTLAYNEQVKPGIYYRTGNLIEGHEASAIDEICGPKAFFERMGAEPVIGNKVMISFRPHGKGEIETREFTICGIVSAIDISQLGISDSRIAYSATISEALAESYFEPKEREYRAYIRVLGEEELNYDEMKAKIEGVAKDIGYASEDIYLNDGYLYTMTDPGTEAMQIVGALSFIILVFAGLVIYSIYYVSVITDVQEIGKLKALGASKQQIKRLFLIEGMRISVFAIPPGLLIGYLLPVLLLPRVMHMAIENSMTATPVKAIHMFSLPLMLLVAAAVFLLVILSLCKPVKMAMKISPIEAIRYQESSGFRSTRKGYKNINLRKLSAANLMRNKKRTIVTMTAMGLSCVLFMCLAGVLGSMRAEDLARRNIEWGDFRLGIEYSRNDKEYPENNLNLLQEQDIFNDTLIENMKNIDGVEEIVRSERILIASGHAAEIFENGNRVDMSCMDREKAKQWQREVKRGNLDYDKMVQECGAVFTGDFFMDTFGFAIGDEVALIVYDGERQIPLTVKIMASMDTGDGTYFALPEELYRELGLQVDSTTDLYISVAPEKYDIVKAYLQGIADDKPYLSLYTMDEEMRIGEWGIALMKYPLYGILAMIAVISFMNLMNTMITSIVTRKRELGVLQAIGLSDRQLRKMLAGEGMVFIFGTLLATVTVGNISGYFMFIWAKENQFMSLSAYHYPLIETLLFSFILIAGQLGITYFISKQIHKESLIDRIRNNE